MRKKLGKRQAHCQSAFIQRLFSNQNSRIAVGSVERDRDLILLVNR